MKKLLILTFVLAIVSIANAGLQISVNGDKNPQDLQYNAASEDLTLDIWTDALIEPTVGEGWWALTAQTTDASITGGVILVVGEPGLGIYPGPVPAVAAGENGVYGTIALSTLPSIAADTTIYDSINFHCNSENDVTVSLLFGSQIGAWTLVDSVVISQVPEPMTLSLLGLGGLLLRRKRTA